MFFVPQNEMIQNIIKQRKWKWYFWGEENGNDKGEFLGTKLGQVNLDSTFIFWLKLEFFVWDIVINWIPYLGMHKFDENILNMECRSNGNVLQILLALSI